MYSGDKLPKWYIGSSNIDNIKNGYNGSVSSKTYRNIYESEQKHNKHLFKTRILNTFNTRKEALEDELRIQKIHNVVLNPKYINKSYATSNGFFGMDVSGENNPNYNKKWTTQQKERLSNQRKGKAAYYDIDGIVKLFAIDDPYIKENNLKHINHGKKYSDETNYKKGSYFRGKKRPEHSEKMKGMNCYKAKVIFIYDKDDNLMYECYGNFHKLLDELPLPKKLRKATKENPVDYTFRPQVLAVAKNNGMIKYQGWYCVVINNTKD